MHDRVLDAVGIHMSMPPKNKAKKGSDAPKDVPSDPDEELDEDIEIYAGWQPPPHQAAAWMKGTQEGAKT